MKKKYVISGYYGFNNFGDELILSLLCKKLKEEGSDVTVFSVNPQETSKRYGVKASPTFNILKVIKELSETDVLISGGGSIFQDSTSINSLLYYGFVLFIAQLFKKETIIYRQGIGPLKSPISRFIVKFLFKRCSSITVRDENSFKMLSDWGIKSDLCDDPVWDINVEKIEKTNAIGIQLRDCAHINDDFLTKLAKAVSALNPAEIKIFSLQHKLDYDVCSKFEMLLLNFLPNLKVSIIEDDLLKELSSVQKLISMRFHALIIGIKSEVECVCINYDPKIVSLAQKYSLPLIEFDDSTEAITKKIT